MAVIQVKVKPGARVGSLEALADGSYLATLKSPPVDGKATAELIALVARHFGASRPSVTIKSGASSRLKRVVIAENALPAPAARRDPTAPDRGRDDTA